MKNQAMRIPCVILDSDGRITDISSYAEPCLTKPGGDALLMRGIAPGDRERLLSLCSHGGDAIIFDLTLRKYRRGIAVSRNFGDGSFCEVYLLTGKEDITDPSLPFTEVFPEKAVQLVSAFKGSLASALSPATATELLSPAELCSPSPADIGMLIGDVIGKLSKRGELLSSRLICKDDSQSSNAIPIEIVPFTLMLTLLLSVLDSATYDGIIKISSDCYADSYEVIMETHSELPVCCGSVHVSALSRYIPRSYIKLSIVTYIATQFGMRVTAVRHDADGILSISFGKINDLIPPTEFKYRDYSITADIASDAAARLLGLVIRLQEVEEQEKV